MNGHYPQLFSPLTLAAHTLHNRICLPATLTNFAIANRVTERWSNFLVERARGGVAMLVSEIIAVDPNAIAHAAVVTGFEDENLEPLAATARSVEAEGALLVGQLWHPGRQQLWQPTRSPMGVSDQPDAYSWTVPHVMSEAELARVAEAYVSVARRLRECGFAGVELHGAHGYLITQLLSPWSNTRTDAYGGSVEGRAKFCLDVAARIRESCGEGFIVGLKMPADEGVRGGIDPDEAARITAHLAASKLFDYFAYGQGNFSLSLENHVPDMHFEPGHFIQLHRAMRAVSGGVPVMALGRIGEPELAERVVAEGYGDLVGMARALVSDAAWPAKARAGQADDIRPCVFNNSCWGEVHLGKPIAEFHNPYLGQTGEAFPELAGAATARKVVVVGAGPAGLEVAWVAAARGHRVTLFGASAQAGGKLATEALLPGHAEVGRVPAYQLRMARRYAVSLKLGQRATAADVLAEGPEVVVLATGAHLRAWDGLERDAGARLLSGAEVASLHSAGKMPSGRHAVLYDHDHTAPTYAVAEVLAAAFEGVTLLTPRTEIAKAVNYCSAIGIHRRLYTGGVNIVVAAEPVSYVSGQFIFRNVFSGCTQALDAVDLAVYVTPRQVDDSLGQELEASMPEGVSLHRIGDCLSPRNLAIAIHEGHGLGRAL